MGRNWGLNFAEKVNLSSPERGVATRVLYSLEEVNVQCLINIHLCATLMCNINV